MNDFVTAAPATLALQRPFLYRCALFKLRRPDAAEDVVQDTLLAAPEGRATFRGESALRTWLTAILKHKISDWYRREARTPHTGRNAASSDSEAENDDIVDGLFDSAGGWVTPPSEWPNPDQALESRGLYELLQRCLAKLPRATARAFYLREIEGLGAKEICSKLGVSESNCCVMLHRARVRLRQHLDDHWLFGEERLATGGGGAPETELRTTGG